MEIAIVIVFIVGGLLIWQNYFSEDEKEYKAKRKAIEDGYTNPGDHLAKKGWEKRIQDPWHKQDVTRINSTAYDVTQHPNYNDLKYADKRQPSEKAVTPRRRAHTKVVREAVYKRDGGRCVECGSTKNLHYDHIIPFSLGGSDTVENTQLLCEQCNRRKGNRGVA